MKNDELSTIFANMAFLEEVRDHGYKARAYGRASRAIIDLPREVDSIYDKGGLGKLVGIPRIGTAIASKIEEFIKTGEIVAYANLRETIPINVDELSLVEGIGPRTVKDLYFKLDIRSIEDLEDAIRGGSIRSIKGMGPTKESRILQSINYIRRWRGRFPLGSVLSTLGVIQTRLESLDGVSSVIFAGSARRMMDSIDEADFVVEGRDESTNSIGEYFLGMPEVDKIYGRGPTKYRLRLRMGININLKIVSSSDSGIAIQHLTGSSDHSSALRKLAVAQGKSLDEDGLFDLGGKIEVGKNEANIYSALGLAWIPPEIRENQGEIDRAINGTLPDLIPYGSLRGDLQIQTNWTDGLNSVLEMAEGGKSRGLNYIAITDHTRSLAMTGGLDEERLKEQRSEIEDENNAIEDFRILSGAEVNILKDGSLDITNSALRELDVVGAAIHSHFRLPPLEQTTRVIKAIENENVDILFHPTGRLLKQREGIDVDMDKIMQRASDSGTVLEINSYPSRLDLRDADVKRALEFGVKLVIDSDAHAIAHFDNLFLGIGQARRGWATKGSVVNTLGVDEFLRELK